MSAPIFFDIGSGDITSKLFNGQMGFKIPFTWNVMRFGFLVNVTNLGATIATPGPQFIYGATAGATNWFGDATCANFIGGGTRTTMSHTAGPPDRYTNVGAYSGYRKVGTTITAGTAFGHNPALFASAGYFSIIGGQITKGTPNFTFKPFSNTQVSLTNNVAQLLYCLEAKTLTLIASTTAIGSDSAQAIDEGADGALDHVMVYWDRKSIPIYITAFGVSKIS